MEKENKSFVKVELNRGDKNVMYKIDISKEMVFAQAFEMVVEKMRTAYTKVVRKLQEWLLLVCDMISWSFFFV